MIIHSTRSHHVRAVDIEAYQEKRTLYPRTEVNMDEHNELVTTNGGQVELAKPPDVANGKPPPDAKALRTEAVGALLSGAYAGASTLKLKPNEVKKLT